MEAEEDCTIAISLDSTYSKAFARRATARVALGKLQEAKQGAFYKSKLPSEVEYKQLQFACLTSKGVLYHLEFY